MITLVLLQYLQQLIAIQEPGLEQRMLFLLYSQKIIEVVMHIIEFIGTVNWYENN